MHPRDTIYRLAEQKDYRRCHRLAEAMGQKIATRLSWPTVVAIRDGELKGFLSTIPSKKALIAGPMIVGGNGNRAILCMRLIETYEFILQKARVQKYLFCIDAAMERWIEVINDVLDIRPYAETTRRAWFVRDLT
ncbi:MAG: hypothetical protein ACE5JS_21705 [Nitrospinota bacterium]